jgi:REP element-mobilizing transposase RayT
MPRPLRLIEPGGVYHVTTNGLDETPIFRQDRDRRRFLALLAPLPARLGWNILVVCLMDTHVHMLVQVADANLSVGMERVKGDYARAFNRWYGRRGHLFRERFKSKPVLTEAHLFQTIRYIAFNPVEVGLADRPEDYVWCSYGATIGVRPAWPWIANTALLAQFAQTREHAIARLRAFVDEGAPRRHAA